MGVRAATVLCLGLIWTIFGCAGQDVPADPEPQGRAARETRSVFFTQERPRVVFSMNVPRFMPAARREDLPKTLKSVDVEKDVVLQVEAYPRRKDDQRGSETEEQGEVTIGRHLAGKWKTKTLEKGWFVEFDGGVAGYDYRIKLSATSKTLSAAALRDLVFGMLESFDPNRRLGGTV